MYQRYQNLNYNIKASQQDVYCPLTPNMHVSPLDVSILNDSLMDILNLNISRDISNYLSNDITDGISKDILNDISSDI